MFRIIFLALALIAPSALGQQTAPCEPSRYYPDPSGDPTFIGPIPDPGGTAPPPVIIKGYGVQLRADSFRLNLTLQGPPPFGPSTEHYRYWLGFRVLLADGSEQHLDIRVGATSTYDTGELVGSNEMGNPLLAVLPATWAGPELSFDVALAPIQDALEGQTFLVGGVSASTFGPHPTERPQLSVGWTDRLDAPGRPDGSSDTLSLAECPPSLNQSQSETGANHPAPAPLAAFMVALGLAAFGRRA